MAGLITPKKFSASTRCFFVSDLHGHTDRYEKLFRVMDNERPSLVFLGGDLLPSHILHLTSSEEICGDFVHDFLRVHFERLRQTMGRNYPQVYLILGNDDLRSEETTFLADGSDGLWHYIHQRRVQFDDYTIYGYACVPPTPFRLKDWERYDVSRYVDPGCTHPMEGSHSVPVEESELKNTTIKDDLQKLVGEDSMTKAVFLFHTPPYDTVMDHAPLDGIMIDHAPLDVHVGSIAVRQFIETRQPYLTLHGHVHESVRITGTWKQRIGRTYALSAAHDGPELCLVRFLFENLEDGTRELL
jgi:Icc-related predicted phosphoesterase